MKSIFGKKSKDEELEMEEDRLSNPEFREKIRKKARDLEKQYLTKPDISEKVIQQNELKYIRKQLDKEKMDISLTYPVNPPYAFVNVNFDRKEGELNYVIKEPKLKEGEMELVQNIKGKMEIAMDQEEIPFGEETVFGDSEELEEYIEKLFYKVLDLYNIDMEEKRKRILLYYLQRELIGWGKSDAMIRDPFIEDISCNGPRAPMYVFHRGFGSLKTNIHFESDMSLNSYVIKLAQIAGKHVSVYQPILDATLTDGSRINLTLGSEVTKKGSTFTIRKFSHDPISPIDLLRFESLSPLQLAFFWLLIEKKKSALISGGTASGKTTLMNALSMFIKPEDKIVSIEDTPEIHIDHENWIQSVARKGYGSSGGDSGGGAIDLYDLLVAALRQRPEYVIVGEVRGKEAFTLFQAISVGHAAMATIHAGSMNELLHRVENKPMDIPRSLFQSLDVAAFQGQVSFGNRMVRRLKGITEILDVERETENLLTNQPFKWNPETDEFDFSGRSYTMEKIAYENGVTVDEIIEEMRKRERFIRLMDQKGVTYYKDVSRAISEYYLDPVKATIDIESR